MTRVAPTNESRHSHLEVLGRLGIKPVNFGFSLGVGELAPVTGARLNRKVVSPVNGQVLAEVQFANREDLEKSIVQATRAFYVWRTWPAPQRGDVMRQIGQAFREAKEALGALVSLEMGKSIQEGFGEVQEIIDICDFAVGLSRQLHGLTIPSERESHRMMEQWHPLGTVGIISAFNFPVAVWAWNASLALVCGNSTIWKPSEKTPLSALACMNIIRPVLERNNVPPGVVSLVIGDVDEVGGPLVADSRLPLISATGSTRMGRMVGQVVGQRLGRSILELGGNNALIIQPSARLELAIPTAVFGAVGTAGQRCTTLRRLIIHDSIFDRVVSALLTAYRSLKVGNPLDPSQHMGPLIDQAAVASMQEALRLARDQGGEILFGGEMLNGSGYEGGCYVAPAIVQIPHNAAIVQEETFAPILYVMSYRGEVEDAINIQNGVRQGLSSAIFTQDVQEAEKFLSPWGSDCGIANVNLGTSGAEIGGAFGGEKETGGGRESGSDSWKAYMRRQTNTINYGNQLPLAQGIQFKI